MNRTENLERELTAWFVDTAAPRTPDYTDDIVRLTAGLAQRPRWAFPERWFPMSVITLARRTVSPVPWRTVGVLAVVALLIAAMLAVYIGSRPKVPPPFGFAANGMLALGDDGPSGDAGDIVTVDPVTGTTNTLVGGPTDDSYPTYSHDGTRIVFGRNVSGGTELFAIDADGTGAPIQLTKPDPIGVYGLVVSPDDRLFAYTNDNLVIGAVDGSGVKTYDFSVGVAYPTWRPPRGGDIAFTGSDDADSTKSGFYLVRSDGSNLRPILKPDGKLLDGSPVQFTPDGGRIVTTISEVAAVSGPQTARVHVVAVGDDGRVTSDKQIGPVVLPVTFGYPISPDGTRVVAAVLEPAGSGWRLAIMSLDDSAPVVLTGPVFDATLAENRFAVAWSPDGSMVTVNDGGTHEVWLLDAAGGAHRRASWLDPSTEPQMWQRLAP
jgi:Tol biopolymer transport system component